MSRKKTSNYRQTLAKPMQKMQSCLYVDDDVMEYLKKFEHILYELSEDVAIIKSEVADIKKMLKERQGDLGFVPNNRHSGRQQKNSYSSEIINPTTLKISSNGK